MIKPVGIPKLLITMALEPLSGQIAQLADAGENGADYVWAFFDGRIAPGRTIAAMHFRSGATSSDQAERRVDAAVKDARAKGASLPLA